MTEGVTHEAAETLDLQRSALQTSVVILQRQRRADQELRDAKHKLESITARQSEVLGFLNATLDASPDAIAAIRTNGELVTFNKNFASVWNLSPNDIATKSFEDLWRQCADQVKSSNAFFDKSLEKIGGLHEEIVLHDGRVLECHVSETKEIGEQHCIVVQWHDITAQRSAETQRNQMTHILERSLNEVYLFDLTTLRFAYANAGALKNLGHTMEDLRRLTPVDINPEYNEKQFRRMVQPLVDGTTELLIFETVHQRSDRSLYNVQVHLQIDTDGEQSVFMALILDITERKKADRVIWNQANFDGVTGLPNRSMLHDRLSQEIIKTNRNNCKIAVMFIDLDNFKEINDTLGHDKGDVLLKEAANRIRSCVRSSDTVARLGGDEFVVVVTDLHDARMANDVAQNVLASLAEPFHLMGIESVVTGSIGITLFPDDANNIEGLFKNADQAMYVSKARGRNQCSYFTRELEAQALRRMHLIAELRSALQLGQFHLVFQPIVEVATGRVNKAEALIRWDHPTLGSVSPGEFIPLAEESGLIVGIGDWVFQEALRHVKHIRSRHGIDFQVSVNKSAVQFSREKGRPGTWVKRLHENGLPGNAVAMEITESLLVDPNSEVKETLLKYRDAGIQVSIDDFGTGYSSLSYLKRFDIDYLKIDQSFTRNLEPGSSDLAISQAVIVMAHALGLKVIAEGVETQEQLNLLKNSGCDYVQGYLISKPIHIDLLESYILNARNQRSQ